MRSYLVAGNWKMHGQSASISSLCAELLELLPSEPAAEIAVFPPLVYVPKVVDIMASSAVAVGAQNLCEHAEEGAFTGEVSASMLTDTGCRYVLVGHSERRALYGETSSSVASKAQMALRHGLTPVVCVGETESQRELGDTMSVVAQQLAPVFELLSLQELKSIVVAYEPVWAIGTGKTATPEVAQEVHSFIRSLFAARDAKLAARVRILYGGSVKAANVTELFAQPDIDGGLVGGASLDAREFSAICRAAE